MRPLWIFLIVLCISIGLSGCGIVGGSQNSSPDPFTVSNTFASVQAGASPITLTAAGPSGSEAVNWTLTYANQSCAPACGTLSTSGNSSATYTPPTAAPTYGAGTITATSTSNGNDVYVFNFQITPGLSVSISNKFSMAVAGASAISLIANVSGDSKNGGVTWTLTAGGANCSPACGTLTPASTSPVLTAAYQPPPTVPAGTNASPTITATSISNTSQSDSFSFTIGSALNRLQGSYSLLLRGYDLTGSPMAIAGSVTADGQGNISGGEFDINDGGGVTRVAGPVSGSYTIDPSFNNVTRGRITIANFVFPGTSIEIAFDFTLSSDGTHGRAVESDGSGYMNTGTFLLQAASALTAANPSGTYAFGLDSDAPVGGRNVEVGRFVLAAGVVTSGVVDQSTAGNITPVYSAQPITSGSATNPDSSGRGTLSLIINGKTSSYVYYIVHTGSLNLLQIDRGLLFGTVQAGAANVQKLPFTSGSVNTTSVLQLTGMDAVPGTTYQIGPDVIIGVLTISGGNQFALTFDENDLGTVLTNHPASGSVTFDPATGRGTFSDLGGFESGFMDASVFYLYDQGKGFLADADISTCAPPPFVPPPGCVIATSPSMAITNDAFSGTFVPQASGPFSASTSISGNLIGGSGATAIPGIPDTEIAINADASTGAYTAVTDLDSLLSQSGNLRNLDFGGTYAIKDTTLGHGATTVPAFIFGNFVITPEAASFYMIGANQFVLIGTQAGLDSGIVFVDPN
jgi:hypothetical protein